MKQQETFSLHRRFLSFYKKDSLALFFCFVFTFMLSSAMLVLIHTNHRTANIEYKTIFTPSDCLIEGLSYQQVMQLKQSPAVCHLALEEQSSDSGYSRNGKSFYLHKGDDAYVTLMAAVTEGRLPKEPDEIAAEKWVLLNLGIRPLPNETFTYQDSSGHTKTGKVTGILSDMRGNIAYGTLHLYTAIEQTEDTLYLAYLTFHENAAKGIFALLNHFLTNFAVNAKSCVNSNVYDSVIKDLCKQLNITDKQVRQCPAREDFKELAWIDIQIMGVILFICLVVFYGIYKIVLETRQQQYGILRALGMDQKQLRRMILSELYQVCLPGAIAGITAGILAAWIIAHISGDIGTVVYLYQERVTYELVLPVRQILLCFGMMMLLIGLFGCYTARSILKKPVIDTISGAAQKHQNSLHIPGISYHAGKLQTLLSLSCNYIFRNIKLSIFVVITISTGITLFVALAYKTSTLQTYRQDTKELQYLNGQYEMSLLSFYSAYQGVDRKDLSSITALDGVESVKTSAGIRVRVIDDPNIPRNDAYYNRINAQMKEHMGFSLSGFDGSDQVYKTCFFGYNTLALQKLKNYVVSGNFDPENLKEDEIILAIPSIDERQSEPIAGWYHEGKRLMDYQAGDSITIKYRADFQTDHMDYELFKDTGSYHTKTYRIAAIVSFEYMYDCNRYDVYPHLITSDKFMQNIAPDGCYQCIYIDTAKNLTLSEQTKLEHALIRIGAKNNDVSTRSLIGSLEQNEMFYHKQMVYIYGISITSFVLIFINLANNIRYRMYTRTREICMLRAVGMSVQMARKLFLYENTILFLVSAAVSYVLSKLCTRYLYQLSDMKLYGHAFAYPFWYFFIVSLAALLLCIVLSCNLLKTWKTKQILYLSS